LASSFPRAVQNVNESSPTLLGALSPNFSDAPKN
jgi:hypothetical protein